MGWAVGEDSDGRWIGYGVPAICDQPECGKEIHRGLDYACGGGVMGENNCERFFCGEHLYFDERREEDPWMCNRCLEGLPRYDATPDTVEWADWVTTDDSWAPWREKYPKEAAAYAAMAGHAPA